MRIFKCFLLIASVICIIFSSSVPAYAVGAKVMMSKMHYLESEDVEVVDDGITDSYGNKYSNDIVKFRARLKAYVTYDLNGAYDTFNATIVCSNDANNNAGSEIYVGIFADGVLVYSLNKYTRQQPPQEVKLDVSGVGKLSIMTRTADGSSNNVYFVDSFFNMSSTASSYPTRWTLDELVLIDSDYIDTSNRMIIDLYGDVHRGMLKMKPQKSYESYALYNLNSSYNTFAGTIVPSEDSESDGNITLYFYLDDVKIHTVPGITKTTKPIPFEIDVTNGKVLKIVAKRNGYESCRVIITDTILKLHEHVLSDWNIIDEPTCILPGKKVQTCTLCGKEINNETIPPLGHTPDGIWKTTREPTCSLEGEEIQHCSICSEVCDSRPIPVIPHTPLDKWEDEKDPTCTEQGSKVRRCSLCGEIVEREFIGTIDHDFDEWKVVKGNNWNNPIVSERVCSMCGLVETEESYPTPWLKPLVLILIFSIAAVVLILCIILKRYYLPLRPSSLKKLFRKKTVTDEDIEKLIKKSDEQLEKSKSD